MYADFVAKAVHFETEEAANGTPLAMTAAKLRNDSIGRNLGALLDRECTEFLNVRQMLGSVRDILFERCAPEGFKSVKPVALTADMNVELAVSQLDALLALFPRTTVGEAKKALMDLFEGWPLQTTLQGMVIAAETQDKHVTYVELAKAAVLGARNATARPSSGAVVNEVRPVGRRVIRKRQGPHTEQTCDHCSVDTPQVLVEVFGHDRSNCFALHPELANKMGPKKRLRTTETDTTADQA